MTMLRALRAMRSFGTKEQSAAMQCPLWGWHVFYEADG
jgi:hypothetical protein